MQTKQKTAYFLAGNLVGLRAVEDDDIPLIARWINDEEVTHFMFYGQWPTNLGQVRETIQKQVSSPQNVVFMVYDRKTNRRIGFAGIYDIHLTAQKGEFRILIGEKDFWGKGYGTEVTELLTFYGFDRLNFHRIYLGVTAENKGGVKAYERAGYAHEGVLKDDIFRNGRYYDTIRMGLLRDEYLKKYHKDHAKRFRSSR
jgi:RimJ/RimL family protein N-acetyltransferase